MLHCFILAALVSTTGCTTYNTLQRAWSSSEDRIKVSNSAAPSVVKIEGWTPDILGSPKPFQGIGYLISPDGHILTAHHTIVDKKYWVENSSQPGELMIVFSVDGEYQADGLEGNVVETYPDMDIALLQLTGTTERSFLVSKKLMEAPKTVYRIGVDDTEDSIWTLGVEPSNGSVLSQFMLTAKSTFELNEEVQSGESGSPLINDDGVVLGMLLSRPTGASNSVATKTSTYLSIPFLRNNESQIDQIFEAGEKRTRIENTLRKWYIALELFVGAAAVCYFARCYESDSPEPDPNISLTIPLP